MGKKAKILISHSFEWYNNLLRSYAERGCVFLYLNLKYPHPYSRRIEVVVETLPELEQLVLKHAQVVSGCNAEAEILASCPKLLRKAVAGLGARLRKTAKGYDTASKTALVDSLAQANPGLDFNDTRRLIGL